MAYFTVVLHRLPLPLCNLPDRQFCVKRLLLLEVARQVSIIDDLFKVEDLVGLQLLSGPHMLWSGHNQGKIVVLFPELDQMQPLFISKLLQSKILASARLHFSTLFRCF